MILVIGNVAALACTQAVAAPRRSLAIGIGCRRGVTVDQIEAAVVSALAPHTMADVACVATLDSKADEPGLVAFCERHRLRLMTFSAEEVRACFASGLSDSCDSSDSSLRGSDVVEEHAGVPGVCEPCALLASPGGALVRGKHAADGVTVAIAVSSAEDGAQRVPPRVQV